MALTNRTKLGPYEIVAPLGSGGMGEVYRARDTRLGRDVAVKVLPASLSADAERLRRFEQEARATGALDHPNIIAIHDLGTHDGSPYVVTELLDGETLRERINGTALPPRKAIDYAGQVARGLAAAHERGIVHRDLKPENLFVTRDGRVKILDFGLAKLTQPEKGGPQTNLPTETAGTEPGIVMGTLGYMSPEQVRGRPADARNDISSFRVLLIGAALAVLLLRRPRVETVGRPVRFSVPIPPGTIYSPGDISRGLSISPDGTRLVVEAISNGRRRLFVRPFDSEKFTELQGTIGASAHFWSPDSRFIAFFADGKLKKIPAAGGPAEELCPAGYDWVGTWGRDGTILFSQIPPSEPGIFRVSDRGGEPVRVLGVDPSDPVALLWPQFLPDGRHFLFQALAPTGKMRE